MEGCREAYLLQENGTKILLNCRYYIVKGSREF
jgi:hypothetical protein